MLMGALPAGIIACGMLGAVLLARLPQTSAETLAAIAALGQQDLAAGRACVDLAMDTTLQQTETTTIAGVETAPLPEAARGVERAALMLNGLARDAGPRRRERLEASRRNLETECRRRFADAIGHGIVEPMRDVSPETAAALIPGLEAAARDLRRFESAARQMGGPEVYDELLRGAAEQVGSLPPTVALTRADRVRLVEILAGSEQALRLLAKS